MSNYELAAIQARVEAITPGAWEKTTDKLGLTFLLAPDERLGGVIVARITGSNIAEDAEFIAHAPCDVRAMLAEIERLQADVKRLDDYRAMWELRFGHTEDY